jgi:alanine dehydrogenase
VVKVTQPQAAEYELLAPGKTLACFLHLAVAPAALVDTLLEKKISSVAYELIEDEAGRKTVLAPVSLVCGRLTCQIAARHLESVAGGRGLLLSGVPGVPAADVVIIGAGQVGRSAARIFHGIGANVVVMDINYDVLREVEDLLGPGVQTMVATKYNIQKVIRIADVVVGAVSVPGEKTPLVITRDMLSGMREKSLIIDVSIDQGGCVETSRPTTLGCPTFVGDGVIHYCVPNMSSNVARTASHLLTNAFIRMVLECAQKGVSPALTTHPGLRSGLVTHRGHLVHAAVARSLKREPRSLESLES